MKLRLYLSLFFLVAAVQGQSTLLFDGAGQMGIHAKDGILVWNSDIFSGPILLDGTLNYFSQKFGNTFSNSLRSDYENSSTIKFQTDSVRFITDIDYQMGDYDLDQLDIEGTYLSGNSRLRLAGFKRSFSGNGFPAQYIRLDGKSIPLQQTYLAEYASINSSQSVRASVLILNGDYNLIGGDFITYGKIEDKVTAGGVSINRIIKKTNLKIGTSLYQQVYDPAMPFFPARTKVRLNRQFTTLGVDSIKAGPLHLFSSLEYQSQGVRQAGQNSIIRNWIKLTGGFKTGIFNASIGGIATGTETLPEIQAAANVRLGNLTGIAEYDLYNKPAHAMISSESDWEHWQKSRVSLNVELGHFLLGGRTGYTSARGLMIFDHDSGNWTPLKLDESALSAAVYASLNLLDKIGLTVRWDHTDNTSTLTNGIGDRITTGISFRQHIETLAITVRGELSWEEYFNRNFQIGFDPHWGIPYINGPPPGYNTTNNNTSGRISIDISTLTIYGSIFNIPNYLGANFSFVDVGNTWVQNNAYIPPMGKMAVIGIKWRFLN